MGLSEGFSEPAQPHLEGNVKEFRIDAQEGQLELRPGVTVPVWSYNGQVPGPVMRVREGERVRVSFRNEIAIGTAIHWHGLPVPNAMDGAPGVTQAAVLKGQKFTYEFIARPAGTYIYHAHSHGENAKQLDMGLMAPLIIDPDGEDVPYDRELILVLDEWEVPGVTGGKGANRGTHGGHCMGEAKGMMGEGIFNTLARYNIGTINARAGDVLSVVDFGDGLFRRF